MGMDGFEAALRRSAEEVEQALDGLLPKPVGAEARVLEAMRYAIFGGGKRLRPFLALASAAAFGVDRRSALRVAGAIECVHTYSLVHDDLPCMDDDDLRRGRPTTHKQFDEATAVLAGDALLTFAFEILAEPETHEDPYVRCELVARLAAASGCRGMVGGQMIDLASEGKALDIGGVTRLQQMKTGALIAVSCEAGAILGRASPAHRAALHAFAHDLGLAFQIADDLLDVEGDPEELGKAARKDADAGKQTMVGLLGIDAARQHARMLADQAIIHLEPLRDRTELLRQAARFAIQRRS
jgi:farnesyl diphosphate synthase